MSQGGVQSASWSAERGARGLARRWARRLVTLLALFVTLVVLLIALGALFPATGWVGAIGTLFESVFSLHIVIAGLAGFALARWSRRLGARRAGILAVLLGMFGTLGAIVPLVALMRAARRYGASISWVAHLRVAAPGPRAIPDETQLYATVEGKNLYADVYLPADSAATSLPAQSSPTQSDSALSAPVVMIHGGGYSGGERSDGHAWDRWLAARGYTVFDIDYRLDPPPTWKDAADDVACALGWVAAHAGEFHIAADRMLVAGQSAGGGLALQMGYGIADGTFTSSCGGVPPQPKAVFALYPPDDFAMAWQLNTGIGPVGARALNTAYIGGSPEQFAARYQAVSAVYHARPGFPPTLIAAGEHDHLVPFAGHREMAANLDLAGVPNVLVTVPYSDHAYDVAWGSLGGQVTRQAAADFLAKYLPAHPP